MKQRGKKIQSCDVHKSQALNIYLDGVDPKCTKDEIDRDSPLQSAQDQIEVIYLLQSATKALQKMIRL